MEAAISADIIKSMLETRVIFDGEAFVPQQPVTLPDQAEAIIIVDQASRAAGSGGHEPIDNRLGQIFP